MLSRFLWLILTLTLITATASSQKPITVAFLGVEDESGYSGEGFRSQVGDVIVLAMNKTGVFSVQDLREKTSSLPKDEKTIAKIANEFQSQGVVQANVKRVSVIKSKGNLVATFVLETTLTMAKDPQIVFKARAECKSNDPSEGRALAKAIEVAAKEVAKQLSTIVPLKGQVLLPPNYSILPATQYRERDRLYERTVRIGLDMISGLKVGSEVVILQGGKPIAQGKVVEVDIGSSLVALEKVEPYAKIRIGDEVRVTAIPSICPQVAIPAAKGKGIQAG